MYNNPLITIPRLQHSPNQAGYSHSHPHSEGATSGRFQGSTPGGTGDTTSRVAPDPNYQKPVLQQGVGDPRNAPPTNIGWGDVAAARDADPRYDAWGANRYTNPKPQASSNLEQMTRTGPQGAHPYKPAPKYDKYGRPITVKTTQLYGTEDEISAGTASMAPPAQSDLVNKIVADAQPEGVVTPEQVAQAAPTSEANASQVAVNAGQSTIAPQAPSYIGQADSQLGGAEEEFQATIQAQEDRAGKDISFGQAEGYGTKAAVVAPEAVTADVADQPWMSQSAIFEQGKVDGDAWSDEERVTIEGMIGGYFDVLDTAIGKSGGAVSKFDDINMISPGDISTMSQEMDRFLKGEIPAGIFNEGMFGGGWKEGGKEASATFKSMNEQQRKELLYKHVVNSLGDSDISAGDFLEKVMPGTFTEDDLKAFGATTSRIENEALGKKEQVEGVLSESVAQMGANVRDTLAKMGQGTETSAEVNNLISSLSESVEVPDEYEVVRDSAGQPVVRFRGKPGKIEKDPETGLERQTYDMTQGRLDSAKEQMLNDALQSREQGQAAVQEHIQAKLGLSIDQQRAQIVSAEFTQSLNLEKDRFAFQERQFTSNNALAEANVTGIFGDQPTLAAQDLMGRLTGKVQTGTRNEFTEEGGFTQSPIMADTVEMQKMRAELIGRFEGQPTINREQFDAAVKGYLADKSPTFAREQWEGEQARLRDEALLAAGEVVKSRYMTTDPTTGRQHEVVVMMDTLEKKRQVMDDKLKQAQLNGLRSIVVPILDNEGNAIPGQNQTLQVSAIEQMRTDLDQQRLDHMMKMEEAALTGELGEEKTLAGQAQEDAQALAERGMDLQERQFAAEQAARTGQALGVDPVTGELTGETVDSLQSEEVQNRMRAQGIADERAGLEQRDPSAQQELLRRSYVEGLNSGLAGATVEDTSSLESALNQVLPPTPAGMVWDGQSGTFKLRAGYEGRTIDPDTQREMEKMAPLLRARDRSERVLNKLQEHKFEFQQVQRMQDESDRRLREALGSADIETAEEEAYRKQVAERKLVEAQAKNEKYTMLFQLLQNPTALGMARRYGVLQQIEQDIGMEIPGVPEAGPADTIPTPEEWSSLNQEERAFRASLYTSETGGSPENFFEMIGRNAPAQMQTLQWSTN